MAIACSIAIVLGVLLTLAFIISKHEGLLSPFSMFYFYMMLYYVFSPIYQTLIYKIRYHEMTSWASFIAVATTTFFYFCLRNMKIFSDFAMWTKKVSSYVNLDEKRVRKRVISGFILGISIYLCSIYLVYDGSMSEVFSNPLRYRLEIGKGWKTLLYSLQYQLIYTLFFGYIAYRYRLGLKPFTLWMKIYAVFITALSVGLGSRGIMVAFLLQALIIYEIFRKRLPFKGLVLAGAATIILFAGYLHYRNTGLASEATVSDRFVESFKLSSETAKKVADSVINRADAFGNFDIYIGALNFHQIEIAPFSSFPNAIQQYIPRDFYPNKPYYFSSDMTRRLLPEVFEGGATYDFTGIAEWIHNFGIAFLPIFGIFPALILCAAQKCYKSGDPFVSYLLIYNLLGGLPIAIINNGFLNGSNIVWLPLPMIFYTSLLLFFLKTKQGYMNTALIPQENSSAILH